jgi:hypothetical protein
MRRYATLPRDMGVKTNVQMDNSVLIEEADPEAIRLDDLESNASVDEDAVPMRKVTANNKVRPCLF